MICYQQVERNLEVECNPSRVRQCLPIKLSHRWLRPMSPGEATAGARRSDGTTALATLQRPLSTRASHTSRVTQADLFRGTTGKVTKIGLFPLLVSSSLVSNPFSLGSRMSFTIWTRHIPIPNHRPKCLPRSPQLHLRINSSSSSNLRSGHRLRCASNQASCFCSLAHLAPHSLMFDPET